MTKLLSSIRHQISTFYHLGVVAHHFFVAYYITFRSGIEKYRNDDKKIQIMMDFSIFYYTGWNFMVQCIYFSLSLALDLLQISDGFHTTKEYIECARNYIFRVFAFPVGVALSIKFWVLYSINPNLIFPVHPKVLEAFFPTWCNHAVHTHIVTALIFELLITCHYYVPKQLQKREICAVIAYPLVYVICFFGVYFFCGVWLYPVYELLNWPGRMALASTSIAVILCMFKCGEYISNTRWEYYIQITQSSNSCNKKES